ARMIVAKCRIQFAVWMHLCDRQSAVAISARITSSYDPPLGCAPFDVHSIRHGDLVEIKIPFARRVNDPSFLLRLPFNSGPGGLERGIEFAATRKAGEAEALEFVQARSGNDR